MENLTKCYCGHTTYCDCGPEEPKQETLQEAAERLAYDSTEENKGFPSIKRFIEGAKWQQERMYSEEEVKNLAFNFYYDMSHKMGVATNLISENATNVDLWFEQFKNK